jgi:hypothetical protein
MSSMGLSGGGEAGRDDEVPGPDPGFFRGSMIGYAIMLPFWAFVAWWIWG